VFYFEYFNLSEISPMGENNSLFLLFSALVGGTHTSVCLLINKAPERARNRLLRVTLPILFLNDINGKIELYSSICRKQTYNFHLLSARLSSLFQDELGAIGSKRIN